MRNNRSAAAMRSRFFGALQLLLDLALVAGSYYLVYVARGALGFPYEPRSLVTLGRVLPWLLLTFVILYFVYNLGADSPGGYYESFLGLVLTVVLLLVISYALSFAIRQFGLPRTMVGLAGLVQVVGLSALNGLLFRVQLRSLPSVRVACVAGSEERAVQLAGTVNGVRGLAATPFVWRGEGMDAGALPAGTAAVVLDDSLDAGVRRDLLVKATSSGMRVYVVPSAGDLLLQNPTELLAGDQLLLEVRPLGYPPADAFFKRILDIVVSFVALVFFVPLFLAMAVLIPAESGRPIFYCQPRLGAHGARFMTIKFRTMARGAEDDSGPVLSADGDTRITRVGRVLRKTGLDEVPQFINVLRGEMSVVGPRPERPELAGAIEAEHPEFGLRTAVKPGITGLAQIRGRYDTPPNRKLGLDISYLRQRSVILSDIYVILNTLRMFFLPTRRK
jgi:lipopolysaccharide/colanic/teichoic acid biosynthesis glycosyltransferase